MVVTATVLVRDGVVVSASRPLLTEDEVAGFVDVVSATVLVEDDARKSVDLPLFEGEVFELCVELSRILEPLPALLFLFVARIPPTPPPTAAPITTNIPIIVIIQNILGANPQIRRC